MQMMPRGRAARKAPLGWFLPQLVFVASPALAQRVPEGHNYWVYVGAESADLIHRVRFGPDGAAVEKTLPVGSPRHARTPVTSSLSPPPTAPA